MEKQGTIQTLDGLRRDRARLQAKVSRQTEAIEEGGHLRSLVDRLRKVEGEIDHLDRAIASHRNPKPKVTAERVRGHVVSALMQLREMLEERGIALARAALQKHVGKLLLTPKMMDGRRVFEVSGSFNLTGDLPDGAMRLVARDGIEPPTPAFSGLRSTN